REHLAADAEHQVRAPFDVARHPGPLAAEHLQLGRGEAVGLPGGHVAAPRESDAHCAGLGQSLSVGPRACGAAARRQWTASDKLIMPWHAWQLASLQIHVALHTIRKSMELP